MTQGVAVGPLVPAAGVLETLVGVASASSPRQCVVEGHSLVGGPGRGGFASTASDGGVGPVRKSCSAFSARIEAPSACSAALVAERASLGEAKMRRAG